MVTRALSALLLGAIEAGGSKVVCGIGASVEALCDPANSCVVKTQPDPERTWEAIRAFFASRPRPDALGVGSFGPLDLEAKAIAGTPKLGWQGFSWALRCQELTAGPLVLDTDVNAAALGEWRYGALVGAKCALYVTVGTGVGGGLVLDGKILEGRRHPEMGHILLPRHPSDGFEGACEHHRTCLEGLASGEAIRQRWGTRAEDLTDDHPAWALEADYLGLGLADLALSFAPDRIVLGGGVLGHHGLLEAVRVRLEAHLGGYLDLGEDPRGCLAGLVVAPGLGRWSGLVGAFELARDALVGRNVPLSGGRSAPD
jgi:fructokinase